MWRIALLLLLVPLAAAHEGAAHDVPAWGSGTLVEGDTYERTFDEVRTHGYIDGFTAIAGSVRVIPDGPMAAAVSITNTGFSPPVADIGPGGLVTWTVSADGAHTVTSTEMVTPEEEGRGEDSPVGVLAPLLAVAVAGALLRRR